MLRVRPFAAIQPPPNKAARVASPPYDVVTTPQARQLVEGNPWSFLHVVRSEIDLPEGTDPFQETVYAKAKANLERFLAEGTLVRESEPALYLYRQVLNHRSQIGLVCCCHVDDYANNVIKKHEKTRPDKENDRTRHILTVGAHTGLVLLAYRASTTCDQLVQTDMNARPLYHFNTSDGVTHTVWRVRDPAPYVEHFARLDAAYIADGHHRVASAARAAAERRAGNAGHRGDEEYNWFTVALFPADQLTTMPYNRVVTNLGGQSPEQVLDRLSRVGKVTETDRPRPERPHVLGIYVDGRWHRLEIEAALVDASDPVRSLDVALLQSHVLEPIFRIGDPQTDPHLDFVGGIGAVDELERRVNSGAAGAGFSLYPTSIEQLMAAADAQRTMPPKSTWFEPKLRSGLFAHEL
ncbi:MAG: DUF1015 domain-containing protein [Planctomycetota bacterium]|jgi:uncharacterized protein (DUF1015 family)